MVMSSGFQSENNLRLDGAKLLEYHRGLGAAWVLHDSTISAAEELLLFIVTVPKEDRY